MLVAGAVTFVAGYMYIGTAIKIYTSQFLWLDWQRFTTFVADPREVKRGGSVT